MLAQILVVDNLILKLLCSFKVKFFHLHFLKSIQILISIINKVLIKSLDKVQLVHLRKLEKP
jgi:hypothetical protein